MIALIFFVILCFLSREILSTLLVWVTEGKNQTTTSEDIKLHALSRLTIRIILTKRYVIEFCSFQTWSQRIFFVHEELWQNLDLDQREALLIWGYSSQIHASIVTRVWKQILISPVDRDSLIQGAQLKSLLSVMIAVDQFRESHPLSPLGHILSGLSLTGPSLLAPWQTIKEREAKLLGYLADWGKAG